VAAHDEGGGAALGSASAVDLSFSNPELMMGVNMRLEDVHVSPLIYGSDRAGGHLYSDPSFWTSSDLA
jgi:hypothetical protein